MPRLRLLRPSLPALVSLAVVGLAAMAWWGTASSTSSARIALLRTVEPYAFATYEQLAFNFSHHGRFFQTIHAGYDDSWTWSGHRSPVLVLASLLYGRSPNPWWLSRIAILGVLAGTVPAALIGRRALRSGWGIALGGLVYLSYPPAMALALQDYQDLVFALPCLVFAAWAARSRSWLLVALGAGVALLPREETIPLAVLVVLLHPPREGGGSQPLGVSWRRFARNVLVACVVAGGYAAVSMSLFPVGRGHDMPLEATVRGLLSGRTIFLDGWPYLHRFYALLLVPFGFLGLLSPGLLLPGLALVLLHMTVAEGMGVDRSWAGHCHHLAPAAAFLVIATIQGSARLLRLLARSPVLGRTLVLACCAGGAAWGGLSYARWARDYNLVRAFLPRAPAQASPAWRLQAMIPPDAVPIVASDHALLVSNRSVSYTYDGSLGDKARGLGLGAGTHLLVDSADRDVVERAMAMDGASVLAEAGGYLLITWAPGARDPDPPRGPLPPAPGSRSARGPGSPELPGVPPPEPPIARRHGEPPPRIRLPWAPSGGPPAPVRRPDR